MRGFLDTNVVCDWLLKREPWQVEADAIAKSIADGRLECLIAATTVTNLFYVARRVVGRARALSLVGQCLSAFEVWPVDIQVLRSSLLLAGKDFEDNVQVVAATLAGSDVIVTRDAKGLQHTPMQVMSPTEFVAALRSTLP